MNICIGIISYFPDDYETRQIRIERLKNLITMLEYNFGLPILIIAQNWNHEIEEKPSLKIFHYDKLGITGARKELRKKFLETKFDYVICFDDDFELNYNPHNTNFYISQLNLYPNCLIEYENYLMNLCAISRYIFLKQDYDDIEAEKGEGFEDWIYVATIKNKYPNNYKNIGRLGLPKKLRSELVNDKYSTWITEDTNKNEISKKSRKLIDRKKIEEDSL